MDISHYCGSFIIEAKNSFLNGGDSVKEGKSDISMPKVYESKEGNKIPYISAQCWRKWWLDNCQNELKEFTERYSDISQQNEAFINPIDDLFGFFKGQKIKNVDLEQISEVNVSQIRSSPLQHTNLYPIQNKLNKSYLNLDKAYIHLKNESPLPYSSRFYSAFLESNFGIDVTRICFYRNFNDRLELAEDTISKYTKSKKLVEVNENEYLLSNHENERKQRLKLLMNSLLTIHGGAKLPQYGCDISPKIILLAGQKGGNTILSNCFEMGIEGVRVNTHDLLKKISDFSSLFKTPIFLGVRKGIIENLEELEKNIPFLKKETDVDLVIDSPRGVIRKLLEV